MTSTKIFSFGLLLALITASLSAPTFAKDEKEQLHGVWVSSVSNIDFPSKPGLSANQMRKEADAFLDRAVDLRLNAIFLQVRPMGDAYYPSKIYPWSGFLSGEQGKAPDENFDALAYWIEGAHKRGLQLHAWVNPYRVTVGRKALEDLAENNPARLHPEWTFQHGDRVYLDPGIPEVRQLVVDGMVEIVENYDVDGIHIDDYFYPERKITEDEKTFEEYGEGFDDIEDWRRHNVDLLIEAAGKAIHKAKSNVVWGVSPAGIWANKSSNPLGSETRGNQCYYNLYADVRGWIKKEWIDYVVPQIYWHIGFEIADFQILTDWWSDVVKDTNVKLYVGTAAYRVDSNSKTEAWRDPAQLTKQLEYMAQSPEVDGQVFFTAHSLKEGAPASAPIEEYGHEHWKEPSR
ncbi:MAG: family 10 glycosylhydrolase [Thermoguttaceae bacterium]|nr:family 10 glycosylhydrolase [Thermoguttaceae bacterium]